MLEYGYQWVYFAFYISLVLAFIIGVFKVRQPEPVFDRGLEKNYSYSKFLGVLFLFPITFIAACRTYFIDTADYVLMYEHTASDFSTVNDGTIGNVEKGFIYFMALLKKVSDDPRILFIVTSIIICVSFVVFIYDNCVDVPFALIIFLCQTWTGTMNGLRQFLVAAIVSLGWTKWTKSQKSIKNDILFVGLIILCSFFHKSVLICIVVFLMSRGMFFNIGTIISIIGTILLLVFPGFYRFVFEVVLSSESYSEYENITSQMGFMRLLVCAVPIILIIINRINDKESTYNPNDRVNWMMNICVFNFCCAILAMKMVFFARLSIYFSLFDIVIIPNLISKNFNEKTRSIIKMIAVFLYVIFFVYQMKAYGGYMESFKLCFLES